MSITLIFWIIGLIVGAVMYWQAYAWGWVWWKCLIFAVAMMLAAVLVLGLCRLLVLKIVGKGTGLLDAVKAKLG